jgi:hypothetical protein
MKFSSRDAGLSIVAALDKWMQGLHPETELPHYRKITNNESPFTMPAEQWKKVEMQLEELRHEKVKALLQMVDDFHAIGSSKSQLSQSLAAHRLEAAQLDDKSLCCALFVCLAVCAPRYRSLSSPYSAFCCCLC